MFYFILTSRLLTLLTIVLALLAINLASLFIFFGLLAIICQNPLCKFLSHYHGFQLGSRYRRNRTVAFAAVVSFSYSHQCHSRKIDCGEYVQPLLWLPIDLMGAGAVQVFIISLSWPDVLSCMCFACLENVLFTTYT